MKNYIKISILIIAMSLAACGSHKSSDTAAAQVVTSDANTTSAPVKAAAVADVNTPDTNDVNVIGTWVSDCTDGLIENINYFRTGVKIQSFNFADPNCAGSAVLIETIYEDYTISGNKIDSSVTSDNIMLTSQDQADQFNSLSYLGYTDWSLGKDFDTIGRDGSTFSEIGEKIYGLVKVDGMVLQLGHTDTTNTGSSDATRPDAYDPILFHKQ